MTLSKIKKENVRRIQAAPFGDAQGRVPYYPRYIQIEHASFCNASCIMCNHFYLGNRGAAFLDPKIIELLMPIYPYVEMIMLNGDGEPFLHPQLQQFTRLYQEYGIIVAANTNLGIKGIDFNEFYGCFDSLSLSCDGAEKETYERIREGLSFEQFCRNAVALKSGLPDIRVIFDVVVMKENLLELFKIVELAAKLGIKEIHFNMLGVNPEIGNESDAVSDCIHLAARELVKAQETGDRLGVKTFVPTVIPKTFDPAVAAAEEKILESTDFNALIKERKACAAKQIREDISDNHLHQETADSDYKYTVPDGKAWCSWGLERCYVDLQGNVTTCCFNVHHYMGNLLETGSFEKIWNGENYRTFRRNMKNGVLPYWCANCTWRTENASKMETGRTIPIKKDVKTVKGTY